MLGGESWSSGQQSVQQRRLDEARRLADGRVSMWVEMCGVRCWVPGRWNERKWSKKDAKGISPWEEKSRDTGLLGPGYAASLEEAREGVSGSWGAMNLVVQV